MDLASIDLDTALRLLSLPRVVGADAEDGEEITAQNGRYGPYLKRGTDSRSLETEDQLFDITLDEALAIYAQPKQRGRAAAKPPMAEFAPDPVSGKKVTIKDGRFGPYVTDGETNVTVPRGEDPEQVTAERTPSRAPGSYVNDRRRDQRDLRVTAQRAYELLADKRAKGPHDAQAGRQEDDREEVHREDDRGQDHGDKDGS
jgi:DNA topoisomerase-1